MIIKELRAETREQQYAPDVTLPFGSGSLTVAGYVRLAERFWSFYKPWEASAALAAPMMVAAAQQTSAAFHRWFAQQDQEART